MGTDVHMYVEYKEKEHKDWYGFGGRINPGRDYALFGFIGGARGGTEIYPQRGFPEDASYEAVGDNYLYVNDEFADDEKYVDTEKAARWVNNSSSHYKYNSAGKITHVSHPDWWGHTWLTPGELQHCFEKTEAYNYGTQEELDLHGPLSVKYYALMAAMLEIQKRGFDVRVIIWFDN